MKKHLVALAIVLSASILMAPAADIGHYNGGVLNIRDYFMPPDSGFYAGLYNYYYTTDRLNNGNGNKVNSVTVNTPGGFVPVGLNVSIQLYAVMPVVMWITPCNVLGARFGGFVAPMFANNSLSADLSFANGVGGRIRSSSLGMGDLYVQPAWLDWTLDHWDLSIAYGFYAPVGRFNTQTAPLPGGAIEAFNNIGLGYWTQQAQSGVAWYPMTNRATAVTLVGTYQYNGKREVFGTRPGQFATLNWGISQYLPLCKNRQLLLEVGPAGYDNWQITDSSGGSLVNLGQRSQVHGAGGQLGLTYVPWSASVNLHGFYEYAATSRFQGESIGLNFEINF